MSTSWSIGKHRIVIKQGQAFVDIEVDGELLQSPRIPIRSPGMYPLTIGKRDVSFHHNDPEALSYPELWVDGVRVPPSKTAILRRAAPNDATCKPHPIRTGGAYRAPGIVPSAKIVCGVCLDPLCTACIAVDGVRCKACFEEASAKLSRHERNQRIGMNIFGVVVCVAGGIIVFVVGENPLGAFFAIMLFALLGWAWYSRKKEKETPPRRSPR